ncbi:MAG: CotH kinase family protein [Phycisphaerales bacterium]
MNRISPLLLVVLFAGQLAAQVDVTSPSDTIRGVPDDGDWPGAESPDLAIDDNVNTKYLHFKGETQPTGFQVTPWAGATVVTGLTLTTANDAVERDPVAFELYGSNASIDGPYTLIGSGEIVDFAQATAWPRYTMNATPITFANTKAYMHYQLLFPHVRNAAGANSMQIAEVELLSDSDEPVPPDPGPEDPENPEDPSTGSSLVISEFKAINETGQSTTVEGETAYPDWIELLNPGTTAVNLLGWHLTDDPCDLTKWAMPAVTLAPGGYLLVFASGIEEQDHPENWPYRDQAGYYHTNFTLSGEGEYLALVSPDLEVVHEYGSRADGTGFPPQRVDLSYGLFGNQERYFSTATPGRANGMGYAEVSEEPTFSHEGGTYTGVFFFLELNASNPDAKIYYTIDGTTPTVASARYTGPFMVVGTMEVLARVYEPNKAPGAVVSRTYVALANDVASFSSNLPIVIVDTGGQSIGSTLRKVLAAFIDVGEDGRANITDAADFSGRGGIKIRGSSTAGAAKPSYNFEVWDENNWDRDVSLLGLPAESDWILYGPYSFDRAQINNALAYDLSNQVGRYAVRTRFVEMYLNRTDGTISASDYAGLYIFMEKVKRGKDRVDVEKLEPWDSTEPRITGGYMLKIDRPDPGDGGFRTARGNPTYGDGTFCFVDPKESEITAKQSAWIKGYLNDFETALYGPSFADPEIGYAKYIDVDDFIDHNLLNMLAMNVDALRLSTHLHKSREGRLQMGPLWDFDRALESTDGRDDNPESWHGTGDGTDYLNYVWWNRLFEDTNFWQKYIDRWYALRTGPFSTEGLNATIDRMADEIREAQARNFAKWTGVGPRYGSFQGEIDHMKQWLQRRCVWIDKQFVAPPQIVPDGGRFEAGATVTLVNPHASGVLYYTLDGSDPRPADAAASVLDATTLLAEAASKKVLVPTAAVDDSWRTSLTFDDSSWITGTGGVGFERGTGYENYFAIDLVNTMYNRNASCYIRIPFTISANPATFNFMTLNVRYDDGFVAYLNGVEIARASFTGTPAWNSAASSSHDDSAAIVFEGFDVSAYVGLLQQGQNLLAVQAMNSSTTSSDFLVSVQLAGGEMSTPDAGGLSGSVHVYTGPIPITESTQVKARVLVAGNSYSPWSGLAQAIFDVESAASNVRINEIMYNPDGPENMEYVELINAGESAVTLYDALRDAPWRFTDNPEDPAIDLLFPTDPPVTLAPGECLLLVKDLAVFDAAYGVPPNVQVFEWGNGKLANSGDTIRVCTPGDENLDGTRSWTLVEAVTYSDGSHPEVFATGVDSWPTEADGFGLALSRIDPQADGNDAANWQAAIPSPGVVK